MFRFGGMVKAPGAQPFGRSRVKVMDRANIRARVSIRAMVTLGLVIWLKHKELSLLAGEL